MTTIKIVDVERTTRDLATLEPDQLRLVLAELAAALRANANVPRDFPFRAVESLEEVVVLMRALAPRAPSGIPEVAARQLLAFGGVAPVVSRGRTAPGQLVVRAQARTPAVAVAPGGRAAAAVAAEEPFALLGLAEVPWRSGVEVTRALAGVDRLPPVSALLLTGRYSPAALLVGRRRAGRRPPPLLLFDGWAEARVAAAVAARLRAAGARRLYYLSSAGAFFAGAMARAAIPPPPRAAVSPPAVSPPAPPAVAATVRAVAAAARGSGEISDGRDEFAFRLSALADLFRLGMFGAYLLSAEGDGAGLEALLRGARQRRAEAAREGAARARLYAGEVRAAQYLLIVEDKMGAARADAVRGALGRLAAARPDRVLGALAAAERKVVETEYANRELEWRAQAANKCPHVALAFRLRAADTAREASRVLARLEKYVSDKAENDGWLYCASCGFRLICTHVRELIQMQSNRVSYDGVRTQLARYAVRYSDRGGAGAPTVYAYFCKVCSEKLSEFIEEDRTAEALGLTGELDAPARRALWGAAARAAADVVFPVPVDPRQFAAAAAAACYPLLMAARAETLRRRPGARGAAIVVPEAGRGGRAPPDLDDLTYLLAVLQVYAYVLNLIRTSVAPGAPAQSRLGFVGVRGGSPLSKYAEVVLTTVVKKYGGLIARIADASVEYVADRFRAAYKATLNRDGNQVVVFANEAQYVVNEILTLDPTYAYGALAAGLAGRLGRGAPTPAGARREFEVVVGLPLPELLKMTEVKSEALRAVLGIQGKGGRKVAIAYPPGTVPDFVQDNPEVNFWARLYAPRPPPAPLPAELRRVGDRFAKIGESLPPLIVTSIIVGGRNTPAAGRNEPPARREKKEPPAGREKKKRPASGTTPPAGREKKKRPASGKADPGAFARAPFVDQAAAPRVFAAAYGLFQRYVATLADEGARAAFARDLAAARLAEAGFLLRRAAGALTNTHTLVFRASKQFVGGEVPITYLYDEKGVLHTWAQKSGAARSVYVYSGGAKYTRAGVEAALLGAREGGGGGPLRGRRVVDVECGVCGALMSEAGGLDAAAARRSLRAVLDFASFFSFYLVRCPEGDLHAMKGGACAKCGLPETLPYRFRTDVDEARAFYDKFAKKYQAHKAQSLKPPGTWEAKAPPETEFPEDTVKFARDWKYDHGAVVRAAALVDAPAAALETVGNTEGRLYRDVLAGVDAPPPPTTWDDFRLLAADSAVRALVYDYNRLRFTARFAKTPPLSRALLAEAAAPSGEVGALGGLLPDAGAPRYSLRRAAMMGRRSPADVLLFSVETLARMALEISGGGEPAPKGAPWLAKLRRLAAKSLLARAIKSERLLAKNAPFNFNLFSGDESDVARGEFDAAVDEAVGEVGEVGGPDAYPADDYGGTLEDVDEEPSSPGAGGLGQEEIKNTYTMEAVDIDEDSPNLEPD